MVRGLCTPGGTLQCGVGSLYTRRYTTVWCGVSVHQEVHYSVVRGLCTPGVHYSVVRGLCTPGGKKHIFSHFTPSKNIHMHIYILMIFMISAVSQS